MPDAFIIDACRTPRGIGKQGKGSLAHLHPQHLASTVLRALVDRNGFDTADVDDVVWGTSSQVSEQSGDLGRMAALDAGYDIKASGVTLDRFCGSGITSTNIAANAVMAGMEDLVISGGTEMMSLPKKGMLPMGANNAHLQELHPQPHQGVCADAIASLEQIPRSALDAHAAESQARAARAIEEGRFDKSLVPVFNLDGTLALDHEEFPRPGTTAESLAALSPSFAAVADYRHTDDAPTYRELVARKFPDLTIEHVHHAGNSSGVVDGAAAILIASEEYAIGPRPHASCPSRRDLEHGRRPDPDAQRAGSGRTQGARQGRHDARRHRPVRDQRSVRGGVREVPARPRPRPREGERERRRDGARSSDRSDRDRS